MWFVNSFLWTSSRSTHLPSPTNTKIKFGQPIYKFWTKTKYLVEFMIKLLDRELTGCKSNWTLTSWQQDLFWEKVDNKINLRTY